MRDTREMRLAVAVGLSAAIGAIFVELFVRPSLTRKLR